MFFPPLQEMEEGGARWGRDPSPCDDSGSLLLYLTLGLFSASRYAGKTQSISSVTARLVPPSRTCSTVGPLEPATEPSQTTSDFRVNVPPVSVCGDQARPLGEETGVRTVMFSSCLWAASWDLVFPLLPFISDCHLQIPHRNVV